MRNALSSGDGPSSRMRNSLFRERVKQRPAGGGGAESALLRNFRDNSETFADIDTKFGVPYSTLI